MNRWRLTLPVVLLLMGLAQPTAAAEDQTEVTVEFSRTDEARVVLDRTWSGPDADRARARFDAEEGDGNGIFTIPEQTAYLERERQFPSAPQTLSVDLKGGEFSAAEVTLTGALGYVAGPQPVRLHVEANVTFRSVDEERPAHAVTFEFEGPGRLNVRLTDGWRADRLKGFDEARILEGGKAVEGRAEAGATVYVHVVKESALPPGESRTEGAPEARNLPGPSGTLVALAAMGVAYVVGRATGSDDRRREP